MLQKFQVLAKRQKNQTDDDDKLDASSFADITTTTSTSASTTLDTSAWNNSALFSSNSFSFSESSSSEQQQQQQEQRKEEQQQQQQQQTQRQEERCLVLVDEIISCSSPLSSTSLSPLSSYNHNTDDSHGATTLEFPPLTRLEQLKLKRQQIQENHEHYKQQQQLQGSTACLSRVNKCYESLREDDNDADQGEEPVEQSSSSLSMDEYDHHDDDHYHAKKMKNPNRVKHILKDLEGAIQDLNQKTYQLQLQQKRLDHHHHIVGTKRWCHVQQSLLETQLRLSQLTLAHEYYSHDTQPSLLRKQQPRRHKLNQSEQRSLPQQKRMDYIVQSIPYYTKQTLQDELDHVYAMQYDTLPMEDFVEWQNYQSQVALLGDNWMYFQGKRHYNTMSTPVGVGHTMPSFQVTCHTGRHTLDTHTMTVTSNSKKKTTTTPRKMESLVVVFFHGHWSPMCMATLRTYYQALIVGNHPKKGSSYSIMEPKNVTLLALAPESQVHCALSATKIMGTNNKQSSSSNKNNNNNHFYIGSDIDGSIAKQFGVLYPRDDNSIDPHPLLPGQPKSLSSSGRRDNNLDAWIMPMASVFVVTDHQQPTIAYQSVHVDPTKRAEPMDVILALPEETTNTCNDSVSVSPSKRSIKKTTSSWFRSKRS